MASPSFNPPSFPTIVLNMTETQPESAASNRDELGHTINVGSSSESARDLQESQSDLHLDHIEDDITKIVVCLSSDRLLNPLTTLINSHCTARGLAHSTLAPNPAVGVQEARHSWPSSLPISTKTRQERRENFGSGLLFRA